MYLIYPTCSSVLSIDINSSVLFIQPIHSPYSSVLFIQPIHSPFSSDYSWNQFIKPFHITCSSHLFIPSIHPAYSSNLFIQPIHPTYSSNLFIQPIHTTYSSNLFIQPIHSTYSFNLFIQPIHPTYIKFRKISEYYYFSDTLLYEVMPKDGLLFRLPCLVHKKFKTVFILKLLLRFLLNFWRYLGTQRYIYY